MIYCVILNQAITFIFKNKLIVLLSSR